ncbi:MAG: hypothetical protein Q4G70_02975 [Pseudomonadota bacterium]|nr:hypothetical protein [Pseudomonadota bacterium]
MTAIGNYSACVTCLNTARRSLMRLLSIAFFLLTISSMTGCNAMSETKKTNDSFKAQQSTTQAKAQIGRWIAPQMKILDATQTLEAQGFSCMPAEPRSMEVRSSVICVYSMPSSLSPERRVTAPVAPIKWFVTLDSEDGLLVADFHVTRTPKEIGG